MNTDELRQALVEKLTEQRVIQSPLVKEAMSHVPRHIFVPHVPVEEAYQDQVIFHKIVDNQLISSASQPVVIAFMLEQLELEPGHKVLEIGAGTGYNAALMAHIVGEAGQVVTIDIDDDLVAGARAKLDEVGFPQVKTICADGGYGYIEDAPYDRIILTVSASDITPSWQEQLAIGGHLVLPFSLLSQEASIAFVKEAVDPSDPENQVGMTRLRNTSTRRCTFIELRGEFAEGESNDNRSALDDDLDVIYGEDQALDPAQIYEWLQGPYEEHSTRVMINYYGLTESLSPWIFLHDLPALRLEAEQEMAERDLVPPLIGRGGEHKWTSTGGLVSAKGMALLSQPNHMGRPTDDDARSRDSFYQLQVRAYGDDPELAQQLVESCQAWSRANRPMLEDMNIYVYPKEAKSAAETHQFIVEKTWNCLGLDLK